MEDQTPFILWFDQINLNQVAQVGGKNASLGEMYQELAPLGVKVPGGFAITASAYRHFLKTARLDQVIKKTLEGLDASQVRVLQSRGRQIRRLILKANLPDDLQSAIVQAYRNLEKQYGRGVDVAVRSSATAEDLPGASFAGQQETFLNVRGERALIEAVKKAIASLFTDRAISYREDKGFSHLDVALSVGVQKMVRSDLGASGVAFTIHTDTGFDKLIMINSAYGLGEIVVQGKINPDEFLVFKPTLEQDFQPIIQKKLGQKKEKIVYGRSGTKAAAVSPKEQRQFSLTDQEVLQLARWCLKIERHFSEKYGRYQPMDVEWAKDGQSGQLFVVQARPETVHSIEEKNVYKEYRLKESGKVLVKGAAVGAKIASGKVRVIGDVSKISQFQKGEVLVTGFTDPDWEPIMKIASAIVTDRGGRTSHAAIVSRELGIPAVVGSGNATQKLKTNQGVTVDCSQGTIGRVLAGQLDFEVLEHHLDKIPQTRTQLMINIGAPDEALRRHYLPAKGVGLGRLEFIIASTIQIHPNALLKYDLLKSKARADKKAYQVITKIDQLTANFEEKSDYYIEHLAQGIAQIGAAFWPHPVIIRFSDFKTNEYRQLLGGEFFEPQEQNPMLGWRGASRYYHPDFREAFGLEVKALRKVRDKMGLKNVVPMVPFCRTVEEGQKVVQIMEELGLKRSQDESLKIFMMCEIPSNVELAEQFLEIFDGLSIGSNDLTQLVLGLDRDSEIIAGISNEQDEAVKKVIGRVIGTTRRQHKYIGICGEAPSSFPEFAKFLVEQGIDSMSLSPDSLIKTLKNVANWEREQNDDNDN